MSAKKGLLIGGIAAGALCLGGVAYVHAQPVSLEKAIERNAEMQNAKVTMSMRATDSDSLVFKGDFIKESESVFKMSGNLEVLNDGQEPTSIPIAIDKRSGENDLDLFIGLPQEVLGFAAMFAPELAEGIDDSTEKEFFLMLNFKELAEMMEDVSGSEESISAEDTQILNKVLQDELYSLANKLKDEKRASFEKIDGLKKNANGIYSFDLKEADILEYTKNVLNNNELKATSIYKEMFESEEEVQEYIDMMEGELFESSDSSKLKLSITIKDKFITEVVLDASITDEEGNTETSTLGIKLEDINKGTAVVSIPNEETSHVFNVMETIRSFIDGESNPFMMNIDDDSFFDDWDDEDWDSWDWDDEDL